MSDYGGAEEYFSEYEYDGQGKFFVIKSEMHGKVLDVEDASTSAGTKIVMYDQKKAGDNDNQLFYEDPFMHTIRSKLNDFALDLNEDGDLCLNPFVEGNDAQMWVIDENRLQNGTGKCADINDSDDWDGARVLGYEYGGGSNQHWTAEKEPPAFFQIKSQMNGKCLDVESNNTNEGANVIMYDQKTYGGRDNQFFFEDETGVIRSKLNGFAFDTSGGQLQLMSFDSGNPMMQWSFNGPRIENRETQQVLDITGSNDSDGAPVNGWDYNGQSNQLWEQAFSS